MVDSMVRVTVGSDGTSGRFGQDVSERSTEALEANMTVPVQKLTRRLAAPT